MFFLLPVGMNYRTERLPLVTFSLIGLNTLILIVTFICAIATDGESSEWVYRHLWLVPAACTWYAPLTSMFVHEGPMHLIGNMLFLFLFGSCVEDMIGRLRFLIFYLVGGLVAEAVFLAMSPDHFHSLIPMGGASGAISGCMGMYLLLRPGLNIEFKYFIFFWLVLFYVRTGEFEVPAWVAILCYFVKDLISASLGLISGSQGGVAFGAHVGGFLGGLALVAMYKQFASPREEEAPEETPRASAPILDTSAILAASRGPAVAASAVTGETPTIFLHDGYRQTGPFTLSAVQAMLHSGEIGRDMSYWSEGMTDWENVVDLSDQPLD